jgi:hypothetical protein
LNILCKLRFQQCILTKQCLLTGNSSWFPINDANHLSGSSS